MPPDLEPFLFLILPQIISPVTTRRKKSRLKKVSKIWRLTEETSGYALSSILCFIIQQRTPTSAGPLQGAGPNLMNSVKST